MMNEENWFFLCVGVGEVTFDNNLSSLVMRFKRKLNFYSNAQLKQ